MEPDPSPLPIDAATARPEGARGGRGARHLPWLLAAGLAASAALLYARVARHPFIHYDDNRYLTENPVVQRGLSWSGVAWGFTTFHVSNWHPLTWLSHMLDVQLFGLDAGAHHQVSVARSTR